MAALSALLAATISASTKGSLALAVFRALSAVSFAFLAVLSES